MLPWQEASFDTGSPDKINQENSIRKKKLFNLTSTVKYRKSNYKIIV